MEVAASLQRLGFRTELEFMMRNVFHSVDIVAYKQDSRLKHVAVEYDGPQHFSRMMWFDSETGDVSFALGPPLAKTALRDRFIWREDCFAGLIVVPFYEWEGRSVEAQDDYILGKLRAAGL